MNLSLDEFFSVEAGTLPLSGAGKTPKSGVSDPAGEFANVLRGVVAPDGGTVDQPEGGLATRQFDLTHLRTVAPVAQESLLQSDKGSEMAAIGTELTPVATLASTQTQVGAKGPSLTVSIEQEASLDGGTEWLEEAAGVEPEASQDTAPLAAEMLLSVPFVPASRGMAQFLASAEPLTSDDIPSFFPVRGTMPSLAGAPMFGRELENGAEPTLPAGPAINAGVAGPKASSLAAPINTPVGLADSDLSAAATIKVSIDSPLAVGSTSPRGGPLLPDGGGDADSAESPAVKSAPAPGLGTGPQAAAGKDQPLSAVPLRFTATGDAVSVPIEGRADHAPSRGADLRPPSIKTADSGLGLGEAKEATLLTAPGAGKDEVAKNLAVSAEPKGGQAGGQNRVPIRYEQPVIEKSPIANISLPQDTPSSMGEAISVRLNQPGLSRLAASKTDVAEQHELFVSDEGVQIGDDEGPTVRLTRMVPARPLATGTTLAGPEPVATPVAQSPGQALLHGVDSEVSFESDEGELALATQLRGESPVASRMAASSHSVSAPLPTAMLAMEMARNAQRGISRFEIRLDPPELGRIDVHLKIGDDGKVQAHLVVERRDTLDMFLRDQRGMERALENAGLKTSSESGLQFSLKDQGQRSGGQERPIFLPSTPQGDPADVELAIQPETPRRVAAYVRGGAAGLDIQV